MSDKVLNENNKNSPQNSNLKKEKIKQMLFALGSKAATQSSDIECDEYNWNRPHPFSTAQLKRLNDFERRVAQIIGKKFGKICNTDISVKVTSSTQHFAEEILTRAFTGEKDDYFLVFGTDNQHTFGFVNIPLDTAVIWVTQLLGETESKKQDNDLSELEESLLFDLASCIIKAVSIAVPKCHYQPDEKMARARVPVELEGTEEICDIGLGFEKINPENNENTQNLGEARILIFCDKLEPVIGKSDHGHNKISSQDISKAIIESLKQMSILVSAQISSPVLNFEQLMDLQVGDILLCDKRIDEPIEVNVCGRTVLSGCPARSGGKYAVVVKSKIEQNQSSLVVQSSP